MIGEGGGDQFAAGVVVEVVVVCRRLGQPVESEVVALERDLREIAFVGEILQRAVVQLEHIAVGIGADLRGLGAVGMAHARVTPVVGEEVGDVAAGLAAADDHADARHDLAEMMRPEGAPDHVRRHGRGPVVEPAVGPGLDEVRNDENDERPAHGEQRNAPEQGGKLPVGVDYMELVARLQARSLCLYPGAVPFRTPSDHLYDK